jgi:hypothetical protein
MVVTLVAINANKAIVVSRRACLWQESRVRWSILHWCVWQQFSHHEDLFAFNLLHEDFYKFVLSMKFAKLMLK